MPVPTPRGKAEETGALAESPAEDAVMADAEAEVGAEAEAALDSAASASDVLPQPGVGVLLPPSAAAAHIGYDDCSSLGNFVLDGATGRSPIAYAPHEELSDELASKRVPYESLRAFETLDGRGWGACCTAAISKGAVVVEAIGCVPAHVGQCPSRMLPAHMCACVSPSRAAAAVA